MKTPAELLAELVETREADQTERLRVALLRWGLE